MSGTPKAVLMPLVLVWLAVHAAILGVVLGLKFLSAKIVVLMLLAMGMLWLVLGRSRRRPLLSPPGMV